MNVLERSYYKMLSNTTLTNKLRRIAKLNPLLDDIILFGSVVRGKTKPTDVDILVLFKNSVDKKTELEVRKILESHYKNVSIISKTRDMISDPAFDARESIFFEGISLLSGNVQSTTYGFSSLGMFRYDFKKWNKLEKTKFYYALNGRGTNQGIVTKLGCVKFSDNVVLVPLHNIEPFREFMELWRLEYRYIPLLIPERMNKKKLLTEL